MKRKLLLLLIALVLAFPQIGAAATTTHSNSEMVWQYGPDGGITFSFSMTVESVITYDTRGGIFMDLTHSDSRAYANSAAGYGISACGTVIGIRTYTGLGSYQWNLPNTSSYYIPPNTYAFFAGRNTGTGNTYTIMSPTTLNVTNQAQALVSPSTGCIGSNIVTDSWTITY